MRCLPLVGCQPGGDRSADAEPGPQLRDHVNDAENFIAFQRWADHGPGDDVVVLVNMAHAAKRDYLVGFPSAGQWKVRVNTTWRGYSPDFTDIGGTSVEAVAEGRDGLAASAAIDCGPYTVLVLSQDPP